MPFTWTRLLLKSSNFKKAQFNIFQEKRRTFKQVRRFSFLGILVLGLNGCATVGEGLGFKKLEVPPEFNQKVILEVSDEYKQHQATRSGYDVGDLQSFHTQQVLPETIQDSFKEMFGKVEMAEPGPKVEMDTPDAPAIFEVKIVDLANDIYDGGENYRGQVTLAVAMKSPSGEIFWQKVFRGDGYVRVDPQFSNGLGPQDAVVDAMRDALDQMQTAIVKSPEVLNQMKYYRGSAEARKQKEVQI